MNVVVLSFNRHHCLKFGVLKDSRLVDPRTPRGGRTQTGCCVLASVTFPRPETHHADPRFPSSPAARRLQYPASSSN